MYCIDKFPIIILSSPRTGSTLLAKVLSKQYPDLVLFLEPDEKNTIDSFTEYSRTNRTYILKTHAKQLTKFPAHLIKTIFTKDAFLIRVRRKNVLDQIVSNYIELHRNVWTYDLESVSKFNNEQMSIDIDTIKIAIEAIKNYNKSIDTLQINYDLDLYYEDLIKDLGNEMVTIVTPKPLNHTEIYQTIEKQLELW